MADVNFELGDMNRYTTYDGKWLPVKIITANTLETVVFGNTEMNDSLDVV